MNNPVKNKLIDIGISKRFLLIFLAFTILFQVVAPSCAWALTGGPSQPEVQSFEPVGTSEMVDIFSGDFNYNIPLLDVDGYPVNISYHSGVTMDQEASWTGLGWNINPGVINRNMRGIPDDFNGDVITKELNIKKNWTVGLTAGGGVQLLGTDLLKIGISGSLGIKFNNYNGIGMERSFNTTISAGGDGKSKMNVGLGINSSSDEGMTITPSVGLSAKATDNGMTEHNLSAKVGLPINSRGGMKALSINASYSACNYKKVNFKTDGRANIAGISSSFDFGTPTYTPQVTLPMENLTIAGTFTWGSELYTAHPNAFISGYYSHQKLSVNSITNKAYGYMNNESGKNDETAILDFNREKDGSYNKEIQALPLTNFTFDTYSVSGQGVGGSYRPFRSDVGNVFDPVSKITGNNDMIGVEVGVGAGTHYGGNLATINSDSRSGKWDDENYAISNLAARGKEVGGLYEPYYFKEANEKTLESDEFMYNGYGEDKPIAIKLDGDVKYHTTSLNSFYSDQLASTQAIPSVNHRQVRDKRNQNISIVANGDLPAQGVKLTSTAQESYRYGAAPNHHIGQITALKTDGSRYVYGIAAYNTTQSEVTFAVDGSASKDATTGLVIYTSTENSLGNTSGLDNYYSNTILPAYAHSYMLTAVLSPDYVDIDNNGPSENDLGNYTVFNYSRVSGYKWRTPYDANKASYNEGLKSNKNDDKANYIYGEKDLLYLDEIVTKNYIATFVKSNRLDGIGVIDKNGGMPGAGSEVFQKKLDRIELKSRKNNEIIKTIYFEYDYTLCTGVRNNRGIGNEGGKLTLKSMYFTYGKNNRGRYNKYYFDYNASNPTYQPKAYNRWGGYMPNNAVSCEPWLPDYKLSTAEYPYVDQSNGTQQDEYSQAWSLKTIHLPSGGQIEIDYESDTYAYVQNKKAMEMFKVVDITTYNNAQSSSYSLPTSTEMNLGSNGTILVPGQNPAHPILGGEPMLVIKINELLTGTDQNLQFFRKYMNGIDNLYFRFLTGIRKKAGTSDYMYEYVSGYLKNGEHFSNQVGDYKCKNIGGSTYVFIPLKTVPSNSKKMPGQGNFMYSGSWINPIAKAALQYGRMYMSREMYDASDMSSSEQSGPDVNFLKAMINSSFFKTIQEQIKGPNEYLYTTPEIDAAKKAVAGKSWIRLNTPNGKKYGGGSRVKEIRMKDNWDKMDVGSAGSSVYGQTYEYENPVSHESYGVATYEPMIGGDENPFRQPVYNTSTANTLAPSDNFYQELPFGESFFPSPSIGYSKVVVRNIPVANVNSNATGWTEHEFYTAKDFPTYTGRTDIDYQRPKTDLKSVIKKLLKIDVKDYLTVSQGFKIELNDMHGKPKSVRSFKQPKPGVSAIPVPYSSTVYKYKHTMSQDGLKLVNKADVILPNGNVQEKNIGVFVDLVADSREQKSKIDGSNIQINCDAIFVFVLIPVPMFLPSKSKETTQFRSMVMTKVIQRFGILEEIENTTDNNTVSVKNLVYDSETGVPVLTKTINNFDDDVYSFTYPAYWYYKGMSPAYQNIGAEGDCVFDGNGISSFGNARSYFSEGDEVSTSANGMCWVSEVSDNWVKVIKRDGDPVTGSSHLKVIRSGNKNLQSLPMANIVAKDNPLNYLNTNNFAKVINAGAIEYGNNSKTFCDCFGTATTNPYVKGTKGIFRQKRSFTYLTNRTQANNNGNSNIREDGYFSSYKPYYKCVNGNWVVDGSNWTYVNEATEFNPYAQEVENKDALGIYSAATFGHKQSVATMVAKNGRHKEVGFESFEDYDQNATLPCSDRHFRFDNTYNGSTNADNVKYKVSSKYSHTGKQSLRLPPGESVKMTKQIVTCDLADCNISVTVGATTAIIGGGTEPYSIEYNNILGEQPLNISGNSISLPNTTPWIINVEITDSKGCKKVMNLHSNN
jgi:hypothetical protein